MGKRIRFFLGGIVMYREEAIFWKSKRTLLLTKSVLTEAGDVVSKTFCPVRSLSLPQFAHATSLSVRITIMLCDLFDLPTIIDHKPTH